ncbi:DUF2238 domain-containing protein [Pelotomaculum terephthalicicum JT]|nr:DUF2238 domain-containing protein [Pelotomaculum terephthalicicum]MCG9968222.1 DUF2238 domain-containing protein [Pelotomaculum terephthalicicum JT]
MNRWAALATGTAAEAFPGTQGDMLSSMQEIPV